MNYRFIIFVLLITLASCGSSRTRQPVISKTSTQSSRYPEKGKDNKKVTNIIRYAKTFDGTRYKYGGTTKRGMDCSGLVYTAFQKENIALPRSSRAMSREGKRIKLNEAQKGDLLFFKTSKTKSVINHVGLIVSANSKNVLFIHSTSSKGVIISNLDEKYWNRAFVEARRVL